jgi:hypothetical protein
MKIKNIPLAQLGPRHRTNVRKTGAPNGIAGLAASIAAHGYCYRRLAAVAFLGSRRTLQRHTDPGEIAPIVRVGLSRAAWGELPADAALLHACGLHGSPCGA